MKPIHFNDALPIAAEAYTRALGLAESICIYIVRDVYGRIAFAVNSSEDAYPNQPKQILRDTAQNLGVFASPKLLLFREDLVDFDAVFKDGEWHEAVIPTLRSVDEAQKESSSIRLMDRQITGQDWLFTRDVSKREAHPPRIVFYSLKGGIGRSTALAISAQHLAGQGKRVLLLDFDLESPGLSSLLLPPDKSATFGIVDWFVEAAVSQGDDVLRDLMVISPLSDSAEGTIQVASAAGLNDPGYLAKLSRTYADVPSRRFALRMLDLVAKLEAQVKPDVVLIDSRAGLHDLSAVSIVALADLALLFCTNAEQGWQGYHHLFQYWQQSPEVARQVRERLQIVYGLFPETDQQKRLALFLRNSWDIFRETLYDDIPAIAPEQPHIELESFSFDESDTSAPHFPWIIKWNQRFIEFDPLIPPEKGGISPEEIRSAYSQFLPNLDRFLIEYGKGGE